MKSNEETKTAKSSEAYTLKAYKGFNADMTCRGFQYEEGKEYETESANVCRQGFHACEYPLDCFGYYEPGTGAVYHEVELGGETDHARDDSKVAATKIKIGGRLDIAGLVKAAFDFTFSRCKKEEAGAHTEEDQSAASATGDQSAASATGYLSAASATGYQSAASATGYLSAASATGYLSAASATGDQSAASATGDQSAASATGYKSAASATGYKSAASAENETAVAVAWGIGSKARGVLGAHIVLADWRLDRFKLWQLRGARLVKIDGKKYKPDTWYCMKDGQIEKAED